MVDLTRSVLGALNTKQYLSEIELATKVKQNYLYVRQTLDMLLEKCEVAEVGEHFSDKYNKLFKYYTSRHEQAPAIRIIIEKRQHKAQKTLLVNKLVKSLEDHGNDSALKIEIELLKFGSGKIDLATHQLSLKDIIWCYELVTKHNKNAPTYLKDEHKAHAKTRSQKAAF